MTGAQFDRFGFGLLFASLVVAIGYLTLPITWSALLLAMAITGALTALWAGQWPPSYQILLKCLAPVVAAALVVTLQLNPPGDGPFQFIVVAAIAVIWVIAFRLPFWWWFWTFAALELWAFLALTPASAFALLIPLYLLLLATNALYKLGADNWPNLRAALAHARASRSPLRLKEVISLVWPVALAATLGVWANIQLQDMVVDRIYVSGIIDHRPGEERQLEQDANYTVDRRTYDAIARIEAGGTSARSAVESVTNEAQQRLMRMFGALAPRPADLASTCKKFRKEVGRRRSAGERLLGGFRHGGRQRIVVDMRTQCAEAFAEFQGQLIESHEEGMRTVENELSQSADEINEATFNRTMSAERRATLHILALGDRAHRGLDYFFLGLRFLAVWTWILLAVAIVAATVNVLCRLLFDRDRSTFRLAFGGDKDPAPLMINSHDQLSLDVPGKFVPSGNRKGAVSVRLRPSRWYVAFDAARRGHGTHMVTSLPQPGACFFRRLFARRLLLTRITIDAGHDDPPIISAQGDVRLLDIYLEQGREIVFRIEDLIAFSEGVQISSRFSMNAATDVFGLGTFYTVAKGEGRLILRTDGHEYAIPLKGHQFPGGVLVAFDHCAPFSLAQSLGLIGVWGNTPSLVPQTSGTSIIDESRPGDPTVLRRIWRILRFVVVPV